MPEELTTDVMLRIKLVAALSIVLGLVTGTVGAVSAVYKVRDGLLTQETEQRNEALKNYPTRQELWQALGRASQKEDSHYTDLKDRLTIVQDKVDGIVVYLRKKL